MKRNFISEAIADPTKNLLAFIFVITFGLGIVTNGSSGLLLETLGVWLQARIGLNKIIFQILLVTSIAGFILISIYLTNLSQWLKGWLRVRVVDEANVLPLAQTFQGLITIMSLGGGSRTTPAEVAIAHHWQEGKGTLRYCWLLCSLDALENAKALSDRLEQTCKQQGISYQVNYGKDYRLGVALPSEAGLSLTVVLVPDESVNDPNHIRQLVNAIYEEATNVGLSEPQLISDYTGGNKSMTAGVVLAGVNPTRRLQYIVSAYDCNNCITSSQVMEVKLSYKLKPIKEA